MTIGQYLQSTRMHLKVEKFLHPDQFTRYKEIGESKGIEHVESGPLVRSSYHAECHIQEQQQRRSPDGDYVRLRFRWR